MDANEESEGMPVSAMSRAWLASLGVLGRLPRVRDAADVIMAQVGETTTWLYAADLSRIAIATGRSESDIRVAADLLASDRVMHFADRPDERLDESQLLGSDLSRVRFAYVIDPVRFASGRSDTGASSGELAASLVASRMGTGGLDESSDHTPQSAPAASAPDPRT